MTSARLRRPFVAGTALSSVAALVAAALAIAPTAPRADAADCPQGYRLVDRAELLVEARLGTIGAESSKPKGHMLDPVCMSNKHPESFSEMRGLQAQRAAMSLAPHGYAPRGAFRRAAQQHQALLQAPPDVDGADGTSRPVGTTPLIVNDERYGEVNLLGLAKNSGRVDSLDYDEKTGRLFAVIGTGGVWLSEDMGESWESIGDTLPSQILGAVAWTDAGGGTLVAVGGEHLMGGNTYTGLGAFWSNDLGETWHYAEGVPSEALGFQVAVDPTNEAEIYVATSMGLYRSTDAGRTFVDVELPVGLVTDGVDCTGDGSDNDQYDECQFANFVTDVVIQHPGGTTKAAGGRVLAVVGYRAGNRTFTGATDVIHSPGNGLYLSETGEPGTFKPDGLMGGDYPPLNRRGRTELGIAIGPDQDHNYVYAIIQDAQLFNCGITAIDAPEPGGGRPVGVCPPAISPTNLNGIYVSPDFGATWTQMASTAEILQPTTHSALVGPFVALFAPGVQSWYNMWINPDPTVADNGAPTRLAFGLEEVWANRCPQAQNTRTQNTTCDLFNGQADPEVGDFEVRGQYFGGEVCFFLDTGRPECPSSENFRNSALTTHPDQHDAIWIPDGKGGVHLVVGNDGGVYVQHIEQGEEIDPHDWGEGDNDGFHTLLPYDAEVAKDGRIWFGLQDNGSGYVEEGTGVQYETYGGDGFFVAVDPDNSDIAYSETTFADMRVTTDGGQTWRTIAPDDEATNTKFSNPFVMDPTDANHLMTAGQEVIESTYGPETDIDGPITEEEVGEDAPCTSNCWEQVFDLGTSEAEDGTTVPNGMSALDLHGDAAYVGYCGVCDILNNNLKGFHNGIATNVGGDAPPERMTENGWHFATAEGLPNRYINSIQMDPADPNTVYVALSGYANRQWVPPGSYLDPNDDLGKGQVFVSRDAGETFTDISGNLPDSPAFWAEPRGDQLLVGNELGVYLSEPLSEVTGDVQWAPLPGIPNVPISTIRIHPGDPKKIVIATFGRGVYEYTFREAVVQPTASPSATPTSTTTASPSPTGGVSPTGGTTGTTGGTPETGGGLAGGAIAALFAATVLGRRLSRRRDWR